MAYKPGQKVYVLDYARSSYAGGCGHIRRVRKRRKGRGCMVMLEFNHGVMAGIGIWFSSTELEADSWV